MGWNDEPATPEIGYLDPETLRARAYGCLRGQAGFKEVLRGLVYATLSVSAQLKYNFDHKNDIQAGMIRAGKLTAEPILSAKIVNMPKRSPCCAETIDQFGFCESCGARVKPNLK